MGTTTMIDGRLNFLTNCIIKLIDDGSFETKQLIKIAEVINEGFTEPLTEQEIGPTVAKCIIISSNENIFLTYVISPYALIAIQLYVQLPKMFAP
jgi:hypothetical protein